MEGKKILSKKIEDIPLFELVDVSVDRDGDWVNQEDDYAVVEKGESESLNYVSKYYNLVQIRDTFREALDSVNGDIIGNCFYHEGRGELDLFPKDGEIGILVKNSVDGSYALSVDFAVEIRDEPVAIPDGVFKEIGKIETYKRIHSYKKASVEVGNYLNMLGEVQETWDTVVNDMDDRELEEDEMKELAESLELGKKFVNKVENHINSDNLAPMSFWSFMLFAFKNIHEGKYKSDIHYRDKVRNVGDTVISECVISSL